MPGHGWILLKDLWCWVPSLFWENVGSLLINWTLCYHLLSLKQNSAPWSVLPEAGKLPPDQVNQAVTILLARTAPLNQRSRDQKMPTNLFWISARMLQGALIMMSQADSCQVAFYQHPAPERCDSRCLHWDNLDSIAWDTLHLARDPLLNSLSPSGYPEACWELWRSHTPMLNCWASVSSS